MKDLPINSVLVCLGCYGDLCVILPVAMDFWNKTGKKMPIVVSKTYADLLDGVSYVEPVIWGEDFKRGGEGKANIPGVAFAHGKFPNHNLIFINPVWHPAGQAPIRITDSFVKEAWRILGRENDWASLELNFDKRDGDREKQLVERVSRGGNPMILAALNGKSSPFFDRDYLFADLCDRFPDCHVVDMQNVKAERPYDLLGLYNEARLLITVDTMHQHLSRASYVPVIALSRDLPAYWNGSPWHKRFAFHCRYSQYPQRQEELFAAARDVIDGAQRIRTPYIHGLHSNGYNPSILRTEEGGLLCSYRYHPERSWQTRLAIAEIDESNMLAKQLLEVELPREWRDKSLEDMRLFRHQGKLYGSLTASKFPARPPVCVMLYGEIEQEGGRMVMSNPIQVEYGHNDWTGLEKNFVFWDYEGRLMCIYQCHGEQIVLEVEGDKVVSEYRSEAPTWKYGDIRGGTSPLPYNGKWMRFFHSRAHYSDSRQFRYHTGALLMEPTPPFKILKVSKTPILSGHEWRNDAAHHHKLNVAIPYGALPDGDGFLVSVGINDSAACLCKIEGRQLKL